MPVILVLCVGDIVFELMKMVVINTTASMRRVMNIIIIIVIVIVITSAAVEWLRTCESWNKPRRTPVMAASSTP